jgi:hypothetical protein
MLPKPWGVALKHMLVSCSGRDRQCAVCTCGNDGVSATGILQMVAAVDHPKVAMQPNEFADSHQTTDITVIIDLFCLYTQQSNSDQS